MKLTSRLIMAFAATIAAAMLQAAEVSPEQAKTAVGNWIAIGPSRMESKFQSAEAEATKTVRNAAGRAVYHAVNLKGGGFVVTSGDTRLSPIIAFSPTGRFSDNEKSPFHALLSRDMDSAMSAIDRSAKAKKSLSGLAYASANPFAVAMSEWAELLPVKASAGDHGPSAGGSQRASVSDVRVDKLLKTEWGQDWVYIYDGADTANVYNYYIPNNYPCGCVATAGAQIMKRWEMPKNEIAQFSNTCKVDNKSVTMNSIVGAFDWDNMFLTWDESGGPLPEAQIRAVAMLTYNIGVAVKMEWGDWYGSAYTSSLVDALKSRFGYKSGVHVFYDLDALNDTETSKPSDLSSRVRDFENAVYASLDAKMPVLLSIADKRSTPDMNINHAIVADGYGYMSGKRYTHLNFGYDGNDNAWYCLPDDSLLVQDGYRDYSEFESVGFNIHPTTAGDVISGRVLDASGSPVSGADVTLYDSSDKAKGSATTDSKGIYSFRVTAKGSYKVRAVHSATEEQPSTSVSIDMLSESGSFIQGSRMTGNRWGVDVKFPSWVAPGGGEEPGGGEVPAGGEEPGSGEVPAGGEVPEGGEEPGGGEVPEGGASIGNPPVNPPVEEVPSGGIATFEPGAVVENVSYDKAQAVPGVLCGADGALMGAVQVTVGKKDKNDQVKVSASVTTMDGKAVKSKAVSVKLPEGAEVTRGTLVFKAPIGSMDFTLDAAGNITLIGGSYDMAGVKVGGNLPNGTMTFAVDIDALPAVDAGFTVLEDALPREVALKVSGGKKIDAGKAAVVKYAKDKASGRVSLVGLDDPKKPNLSGLKLTYMPKTGMFKGSFKLCTTNEGVTPVGKNPKLKKYTVNVIGFMINGGNGLGGTGQATMKKPAAKWNVMITPVR